MAKKTAGISIRIEPELKVEAEKILNDLNVSVSELISVLYKQIIIKQGIPFPIDLLEDENQSEKYAELLKERLTYSIDGEGNINSCYIDDIIDEVTEVFNGNKEKWWGTALDNTIL